MHCSAMPSRTVERHSQRCAPSVATVSSVSVVSAPRPRPTLAMARQSRESVLQRRRGGRNSDWTCRHRGVTRMALEVSCKGTACTAGKGTFSTVPCRRWVRNSARAPDLAVVDYSQRCMHDISTSLQSFLLGYIDGVSRCLRALEVVG